MLQLHGFGTNCYSSGISPLISQPIGVAETLSVAKHKHMVFTTHAIDQGSHIRTTGGSLIPRLNGLGMRLHSS